MSEFMNMEKKEFTFGSPQMGGMTEDQFQKENMERFKEQEKRLRDKEMAEQFARDQGKRINN